MHIIDNTKKQSLETILVDFLFQMPSAAFRKKLVFVGDENSGKRSLQIVFSQGELPEMYRPAVVENFVADIEIDQKQVCTNLL